MDGTENEHPDIEVKGFPTILFFAAEKDAKPISFEGGDRSLKVGELGGGSAGSHGLCMQGLCWLHS